MTSARRSSLHWSNSVGGCAALTGRSATLQNDRIPNRLHFCFGFSEDFGGRPFGLSHYVCIASAVEVLKPDAAHLYYGFEPSGFWWNEVRKLIDCVEIDVPRTIFGNPLGHPAHRADVTRLDKLITHGGVYLDTDVFVHRHFRHLYGHSVVLGREGALEHGKLCNAVILAEPEAPFLLRWREEYRDFRGSGGPRHWNEHSVLRPAVLAERHPQEITILSDRSFFWPLFDEDGLRAIFAGNDAILSEETLATHLWESKAWHRYLAHLTVNDILNRHGNFHTWARPYVRGFPKDVEQPTTMQLWANTFASIRKSTTELAFRIRNRLDRVGRAQR